MREDLEKRYIKMLCEDYSKEQLAKMIIKRNNRICEIRAFINEIYAGDFGITFDECTNELNKVYKYDLALKLYNIKGYLSSGNKYLQSWVDGE